MSTSTFHPFPRLPKELRLDVFKLALPEPRIIECRFANYPYLGIQGDSLPTPGDNCVWVANAPLTSHLQLVSSEARDVFLQTYTIVSLADESNSGQDWKPTTAVDFNRDTLYFKTYDWGRRTSGIEGFVFIERGVALWADKVKTVALDLAIMEEISPVRPYAGYKALYFYPDVRAVGIIEKVLGTFPSLEQLYLVIDGKDPQTEAPRRMVNPMDSDYYACWHELSGRHRAINWIPNTVAALQAKRNATIPLKINLKLLVNRSSPCGTTNRLVGS